MHNCSPREVYGDSLERSALQREVPIQIRFAAKVEQKKNKELLFICNVRSLPLAP